MGQDKRTTLEPDLAENNGNHGGDSGKGQLAVKTTAGIMGLAIIAFLLWFGMVYIAGVFDKNEAKSAAKRVVGTWNGTFQDSPATLSIDSAASDSLFARMTVQFARKTEQHRLLGKVIIVDDQKVFILDDLTARETEGENLNGSYRLRFGSDKENFIGTYTSYADGTATDITFVKKDPKKDSKQPADTKKKKTGKRSKKTGKGK
jgi:hypothetical protein